MGTDLVSACIFCAGWLLGMDLTPRDGLSGQMGFSYATMARRLDVLPGIRVDSSDVTPKFVLVGMGNAWPAPDGLGAGTPASEWRARIAFGTSHDQQERKALDDPPLERILTSGTGRYENFALLGRVQLDERDSVEFAVDRRAESATDLITIGPDNGNVSSSRSLSASRADFALGWRHRWPGFEAEIGLHGAEPNGYNSSLGSFQQGKGTLWGGEAEARWRHAGWTLLLHGEGMWGNLDVHRESEPEFVERDTSEPASLAAIRVGGGYSWTRTDIFLTTTFERQKLPFVAIAVTGTEQAAFDRGYDPNSVNDEVYFDLAVRYAVTPAIRIRLDVALAWGAETVSLDDPTGALPPLDLDVHRRGIFGGGLSTSIGTPEAAFFLGADFAIGAPPPPPPAPVR
ncbi:MAG TPA: hypothetical protein VMH79_05905 [Thermoanaerobaculia bacterium]|nr:hypothetical protein [Thermoanaerobaculia bacterium]